MEMMDREKVIKCLEACTGGSDDCAGHTCPYWDFDDSDVSCRTQMELDALAMLKERDAVALLTIDDAVSEIMDKHYKRLKEQEAVEAIVASDEAECTWYYVCPKCRIAIDYHDAFCRHCGRAMKWE